MLWSRFKKHRAGLTSLIVLLGFAFLAISGPLIAPYDPRSISRNILTAPSLSHLIGTDNLGRDVLSQVMYGVRVSMLVGFFAALISTVIGIGLGGSAAYFGGVVENTIMRFTDAFMVIPPFFLILLVSATYGGSIMLITIMIGATTWPITARVVRAEFLSLREREFIVAQKALGSSGARIMFLHLLPNSLPPVLVIAALRIGGAVIQEASLSFLGLGDPNAVSLGQMLMNALQYMRMAWWTAVFPGVAIFVIVLSFNLVSDALNDAFNPKSFRRI